MKSKMNKILMLLFVVSLVAGMILPATASASKLKTNDKEVVIGECVGENGEEVHEEIAGIDPDTNEVIIKRVTVHKDKSHAKSQDAMSTTTTGCYNLMSVKWAETPVSYAINPSNLMGLDKTAVTAAISTSVDTWDNETPVNLTTFSINLAATYDGNGIRDGENSIVFGNNVLDTGVIAVTSTWYTRGRNKQIVEFDMSLETDYLWSVSGEPLAMDVQNIVTHELGHAIGLADLYDTCTLETMYGYSTYGETMKRTLNSGDKAGLISLYP